MSHTPEKNDTSESTAIPLQLRTEESRDGNLERDARIRSRAYELYLERGHETGNELDDWLQAEREFDRGLV